jgi:long-chain acyl-CoA synthetase
MVVEAKERVSEPGRNAVPPIPALDERSLAQIIEAHAREAPQAPCLEYLGVSINYAELDRWANRFAIKQHSFCKFAILTLA